MLVSDQLFFLFPENIRYLTFVLPMKILVNQSISVLLDKCFQTCVKYFPEVSKCMPKLLLLKGLMEYNSEWARNPKSMMIFFGATAHAPL